MSRCPGRNPSCPKSLVTAESKSFRRFADAEVTEDAEDAAEDEAPCPLKKSCSVLSWAGAGRFFDIFPSAVFGLGGILAFKTRCGALREG